jgi:hypothetical protein
MLAAALPSLLVEVAGRIGRITLFIAIGLFLANLAVEFGAIQRIAALSKPLTKPANLPTEVGSAILATTGSATAGYGMLAEFRESGMLDDRATLVAVTINTFFGFVQHIFTFYVPVLIPILGLRVGVMYVGIRALISLGITLVGILAGAVLLSESNVDPTATPDVDDPDAETESNGEVLRAAADTTLDRLRSIVPRLAIIYAIVTSLVEYYDEIEALLRPVVDLGSLTAVAGSLTNIVGLPGAATPVIAAFALDTTSGAFVIAPLIENGTFTARQAVATMLVGGIVSFAVSTFKRSIPFQYGIWGPEFGSKVVIVNTALKIVFIAIALVALLGP